MGRGPADAPRHRRRRPQLQRRLRHPPGLLHGQRSVLLLQHGGRDELRRDRSRRRRPLQAGGRQPTDQVLSAGLVVVLQGAVRRRQELDGEARRVSQRAEAAAGEDRDADCRAQQVKILFWSRAKTANYRLEHQLAVR